MIHIQIVSRDGDDIQSLIRKAIAGGQIKSFAVAQVKGGLKISHKKHLGSIRLERTPGALIATAICKNAAKEWQLLEAFVGRLTYHFRTEIAAINIQLPPEN